MKRSRAVFSAALAGAILITAPSRAEQTTHPFSVLDMLAMERISCPRVSPDGRMVAFQVRTSDLEANRGRLALLLAATDGTNVRRPTTHEADDGQPRWAPDGRMLYFVSTRSGSAQVWRSPSEGGEAEQVTRLPLDVDALEVAPTGGFLVISMTVFPGLSPDATRARLDAQARRKGSGLVFDRLPVRHWDSWGDGRRNHVFRYDLATGISTDLMKAMDADCPTRPFGDSGDFTISPDGARVIFSAKQAGLEEAWSTNLDLFVVRSDGSQAPLQLTANAATDAAPRISPDGQTLAYLAMQRAGYEADRYDVMLRDLTRGVERRLTLRADDTAFGDRSPSEIAWTADGRALLLAADHLGQRALFLMDAADGRARMLVGEGFVSSPQSSADGRILYGLDSLRAPAELHTIDADGRDDQRITRLNDSRLASARLGRTEQFLFRGARGEAVYGYLVFPVDFDARRKYPVALLIHGGPQSSMGNQFHYRWNAQAYAGAGFATVMIDFHGSTGYGQAFTDSINDDWGGVPYRDLMHGLDAALVRYPFLDEKRMGALGASFGGYMINLIAGRTQRFKCLVAHDGNLDERMAYFETDELWFPEWDHRGLPWRRPEGYAKHNPIEHVGRWKTPMLVIHGLNDYRIVYTQALSTFTALTRQEVPARLLVFPDENHWVLKPQNSIQWHETVLAWLKQWL